ncbi:AraC family transcriptional regulator [Pseudomonas sp. ZM23]|uniref:AraC family transcriptional regulator n=1 Tax=Pseudomonas triclosanedens TaxID=2961893 RepID=A0ABY6ZRB0_9PSED|nr:AraC family transcriptional regulator [Pseudomonas triclosanedens]MCP8465914.1 AraC family transcriptional regulator [Pseudomonas triclosanedens]MCP8472235.1 AraC family transcriptional regulator [Pseudomonas triclosanedens]MCP8477213.1 AraC family transcriptional regulator [Pseudomonas triclosanedens]WAI47449.1 AraC family transcriptional regulator [Pseudomonas triclosanedens]
MEASAALVHQVHVQILAFLPKHCCTLANVAKSLELNLRTLQRHLAAVEMNFEDCVDEVRRVQAENLLCHSDLSAAEIARLLGYVRASSFDRAHRRWFSMTPLEHRDRLKEAWPLMVEETV